MTFAGLPRRPKPAFKFICDRYAKSETTFHGVLKRELSETITE